MKQLMLLSGTLFVAACSGGKETPKQGKTAEVAPAVRVALVTSRAGSAGVTGSGTLVAREEAALGAELSGYRVLRVLADEGEFVRQGEALAFLDPGLLEGEISRAQVALARARSENARVAGLRGTGVIADETISQRGFEVQAAAAQLNDLRRRRDRLTLRAPVSGIVIARSLRPGDISGSSTDPFFRIARQGIFELDAELPEPELKRVRSGNTVPVTLATGERLLGKVRIISPRVDAQNRLGRVRISLPASPALRLGGFAKATLGQTGSMAPAVPERALLFSSDGAFVLVVDKNSRVQRMPVRTGGRSGGWVELQAGPPIGTRVVLGGAGLVLPGEQVKVAEVVR